MAKFEITVEHMDLDTTDTEVFEGASSEEAAFRAGFSLGAYWALMIPTNAQFMVGDASIEDAAAQKIVTVKNTNVVRSTVPEGYSFL